MAVVSDNRATLQAILDCAALRGGNAVFPRGTYYVEGMLHVRPGTKAVIGAGMDRTVIISRNGDTPINGPVLGAGWLGSVPVSNVTISDMTIWQATDNGTACKCVYFEGDPGESHNLTFKRMRFKGSVYEGIVCGSWIRYVTVEDCLGEDCGNGTAESYPRTTAAFNVTSLNTIYRRCIARRCGQAFEFGASKVIIEDCQALEPGQLNGPNIAFNCGSTGAGVWDVLVTRCVSVDYRSAFVCGNGIGRLAKIELSYNDFTNGTITFSGGKVDNNVPQPTQGPTTYGSRIHHNTVIINGTVSEINTKQMDQAISYISGISDGDGLIYGREPLTIDNNTIIFIIGAGDQTALTTPTICIGGEMVGAVVVDANEIRGRDAAPSRGDVQALSVINNIATPGFPTLAVSGTRCFKLDGSGRTPSIRIEGR